MGERFDPRERDRLVGRMRTTGRALGVVAAGATAALSFVSAHAFRGHDGKAPRTAAAPSARARAARIGVPPPQHVPAIDGSPPPLQPPASAPEAPPPEPAPAPVPQTSGAS
jgi:hypothetical protein